MLKKEKQNCNGCGACLNVCPRNAIFMAQDEEGFRYPQVSEEACIHCNLCITVCPLEHPQKLLQRDSPRAFVLVHREAAVLQASTSGGAFTALAQVFCKDEFQVWGAIASGTETVEHTAADSLEQLEQFRKSKYLQSDIKQSFQQVKKALTAGKRVLFSGTPCQIAGLKSFLNKDYEKLLTVEIICHGVPSPLFFHRYLTDMERKFKASVQKVEFRNKEKRGWKNSEIVLEFANGKQYRNLANYDDPFIHGFHAALCQRPACYSCPFAALPRCADFTIGDCWGIEQFSPHHEDPRGVSILLCNSQKAEKFITPLYQFAELQEIPLTEAINSERQLRFSGSEHLLREAFIRDLKSLAFSEVKKRYLRPRPLLNRLATRFLGDSLKLYIKRLIGKVPSR